MIAPSGSLSLSLTGLSALIAASPTWQTWVGHAGDAAAAANSIYIGGLPLPEEIDGGNNNAGYTIAQLNSIRPFSLLMFGARAGAANFEQYAMSDFLDSYNLLFSFEDVVDAGDLEHFRDAQMAFLNNVGGVIDDILGLGGQNGLPNIQRLRIEKSITRADRDEIATRGDYIYMMLSVELGI